MSTRALSIRHTCKSLLVLLEHYLYFLFHGEIAPLRDAGVFPRPTSEEHCLRDFPGRHLPVLYETFCLLAKVKGTIVKCHE